MSQHLTYRPDIDGLRAVAIIPVVLYHAFPDKLPGGFIGVDIFFVISGFLISGILQQALDNGSFSFAGFYARRARRLLPALLTVIAACLLFGWFQLLPDEFAQLQRHAVASTLFVQNFALWREAGYFDAVSELKPLMHLWSLSIEEQFYLLYPLLLWSVWRMRTHLRPALAIGVLAFASLAANLLIVQIDPVQDFFGPHTRAWELLAGAWLASLRPSAVSVRQRNLMAAAGALLLCAAFFTLRDGDAYPGWRALLPVCGALLLLAAGPQAWFNRRLLARRGMVAIGLISYPLYLWHWPLLSFSRISDGLPSVERNGALLLSFALAWLTWRYIERPLRHGGGTTLRSVHLWGGALLLLAVAVWAPAQNSAVHQTMQRFIAANKDNAEQIYPCTKLTGKQHAEDWCHPGNAAGQAPAMALLGDSFSHAYVEMIARSTQQPFVQWGRGHCPPVQDYGPAFCREIVAAELAAVAANTSLRTVVLAAHWPIYDAGMQWPRFNHRESGDAFRQAFAATVQRYQAMGKRVVVLLSPPTGANPETCVPRAVHLVSKGICQRSLEQGQSSDGSYRHSMLPLLAQYNVAYFDPFPLLCDAATGCKLRDGDHMLYADWMHLSRAGGRWLAVQGAPQLRQVLSAP